MKYEKCWQNASSFHEVLSEPSNEGQNVSGEGGDFEWLTNIKWNYLIGEVILLLLLLLLTVSTTITARTTTVTINYNINSSTYTNDHNFYTNATHQWHIYCNI